MTQPPSHDPQDPNAPRSGAPDQWGSGQPYGEQQPPAYGQGQWAQPGQEQYGQPGGQEQWGGAQYGQPGQQPYGQPAPGQQPYGYGYPPPSKPTNVLAILALVFAFVFSPAGIVLGHVALKQVRERGEEGEPLAKWGLILSYIFTGLYLLACCGYGAVIAFAVNDAATTTPY